ncbi:MAG: PIN domain-containing protein [Methanoregula sp.]|uniref:PIN domain-containing protein n=1 Tax=Methanoregula sp. TaxID=2052170 RepID=UPI003FD7DA0D
MTGKLDILFKRYRRKGILVDTNLLLLWLVGRYDRSLIHTHKRTQEFVPEDFDTLYAFLREFATLATTPNILTEVSNLAAQMRDPRRATVFFEQVFAKEVRVLAETYVPSATTMEESSFRKLGLTDCCILALAKGKYLLLTDDFCLAQCFESIGGHAVNFNHIRLGNWKWP